jgi:outer membrane protein OmpA-like peptidoglycan-associated protein
MPAMTFARLPWTLVVGAALGSLMVASPVSARKGKGAAGPARGERTAVFRVQVDKSHALDEHWMEIRMSRPPGKIQLTVKTEEGAIIDDVQEDFTGKPANAPLVVRWKQDQDTPTGSISLRMYDRDEHYIEQEYSAWYVPIPHEEVNFRTDSSDIDPPEVPKLDAAFGKIQEVLAKDKAREHKNLTLYIAGHTDTVGNNAYNLGLSMRRAQSLARWFRQKGVRIPIAYEGFGETVLRVQTPDNTDEVRNRRADYIIADEAPPMKVVGGGSFKPAWKRI